MGIREIKLGPKSPLLERAGVGDEKPAPSLLPGDFTRALPPERAGREGDQALPSVGTASVFAEVRRRLDEREAVGVKRYGRSLETFNGRDACRDLEEELLDGIAYATQVRLEHRAVIEGLLALARYARGQVTTADAPVQAALQLAAKLEVARVR